MKYWYNVNIVGCRRFTTKLDDEQLCQFLTDKVTEFKSISVIVVQDERISDDLWTMDNVISCKQDENIEIKDDSGAIDEKIPKAIVMWNNQKRYLMFNHDTTLTIFIYCYNK